MTSEIIYYDPSKPIVFQREPGTYTLVASRQKEIDKMAPVLAAGGHVGAPRISDPRDAVVKVIDLWAVLPELEGEDESPADFAAHIQGAAELARQEDSLVEIRDRFEFAVEIAGIAAEPKYTGPQRLKEMGGKDDNDES